MCAYNWAFVLYFWTQILAYIIEMAVSGGFQIINKFH